MTTNELEGQISLEDYLENLDGPLDTSGPELGTDDVMANRLLRDLAAAERQIAANTAMAERERAKITRWEATVNEPLQKQATWLRTQLEDYALHVRESDGRATVSLPYGTISTTREQVKWSVNSDEFIAWAATSGISNLYRVKHEPAMTVIKGAFAVDSDGNAIVASTGEPVPGITVSRGTTYKPSVKPTL